MENTSNTHENGNNANTVLYAVFSSEFDKWEKIYNPSNYFIDNGRTIPYDFHHFCSNVWGAMQHQRGTWFEMFREQMLNTATNWQNNLKDALWETVRNFNINSV
jgi:hypothetical protein